MRRSSSSIRDPGAACGPPRRWPGGRAPRSVASPVRGMTVCGAGCVAGATRGGGTCPRSRSPRRSGAADLLILGGPVWAGRFAPPLRRLMSEAHRLPPVAGVFVTRLRRGSSLHWGGRSRDAGLGGLRDPAGEPPPLLTLSSRRPSARQRPGRACPLRRPPPRPCLRRYRVPAVLPGTRRLIQARGGACGQWLGLRPCAYDRGGHR